MIPTVTLENRICTMNFSPLLLAAKMNNLMIRRLRRISSCPSIAGEEFKKIMTMTGGATVRRQLGSVNIAGVRFPTLILLNLTARITHPMVLGAMLGATDEPGCTTGGDADTNARCGSLRRHLAELLRTVKSQYVAALRVKAH